MFTGVPGRAPVLEPGPNRDRLLSLMARLAATSFERLRIVVWFFPDRSATQFGRVPHGTQEQEDAAVEGGEPGLRRDRHRQGPSLRGRRSGLLFGTGPGVRRLHPRSAGDGGLAFVVRRDEGGDGIDFGLLDPGLRGAGARRLRGASGAAPDDEADRRAQERRARLPVDLAAAVLRAAAGRLPPRRCGLPSALLCAPDEAPDRRPLAQRAAHAEGADRDECPAGLCAHRHHGADRHEDPAGDHRRRTRSASPGVVPAPAGQGQRRQDRRESGRHLARGASLRRGAGHAALRLPRPADRGLRGADRGADRRTDAAGRFRRRRCIRRHASPGSGRRGLECRFAPQRRQEARRTRQGIDHGPDPHDGRRPDRDPDHRHRNRPDDRLRDRPGLLRLPFRPALLLLAGGSAGHQDQRRQALAGPGAQGGQPGRAGPAHGGHVGAKEPDLHRRQTPRPSRPKGLARRNHRDRPRAGLPDLPDGDAG